MRASSETWFVGIILALFVGLGAWLLYGSQRDVLEAFPPYSTYSPRPQGLKAFYSIAIPTQPAW
jgi:hypothetical protein